MSNALPWDRFTPTSEPVPPAAPVPVPTPRPPVPAPPMVDVDALARDSLTDALEAAWPALRDQAVGYAKDSVKEILAGHTVDVLHPTVTAEDVSGRELIVADAKSRSWRTLVQGLIFDVFAAIVAAVALLSGADPLVKETWVAFGVLLLKSVVSAVISYFMRLRITPTIRTEGEKMALMPVPRPMINDERNTP